MKRIRVIDSHTEGEPTRVVLEGAPDLGSGTALERQQRFATEHDNFRAIVANEPRGSDAMVGALLLDPVQADAVGLVIYFNNVGTLHMCAHGTIGVARTLAYLGRIGPGQHKLETSVGDVMILLDADGQIAVENVPSYRYRQAVECRTERHGVVRGDIAWGGNWFFLIGEHDQSVTPGAIEALTEFSWDVRQSLSRHGITGEDGGEIDHIEVFGPPERADADSKNFVLCPGKAYDRSPCGTGTSAKIACLAADGKLGEGEVWRQESCIGSLFEATYVRRGDRVVPTIRGRAFITAESTLLLEADDPFQHGISTGGLQNGGSA